MRLHTLALPLLALGLAAGVSPLHAQRATDASFATRQPGVATSTRTAYPGDIVRLRIWREPDMSGEYVVDVEGRATLPRLGAVQVTGISSDSLQQFLVTEYARYLRNPSVEVTLLQRVRVVGAVRNPGLYNADPTMGVRDVLALAGGATTDGRTDQVRLDREGRSTWITIDDAPPAAETRPRSGDQLFVPQRHWLARNTPMVAAMASVAGALLIALSTR